MDEPKRLLRGVPQLCLYLREKHGIYLSENTLRVYRRRADKCPPAVQKDGGGPLYFDTDDVDAWVAKHFRRERTTRHLRNAPQLVSLWNVPHLAEWMVKHEPARVIATLRAIGVLRAQCDVERERAQR